jgi:hypothetical protein
MKAALLVAIFIVSMNALLADPATEELLSRKPGDYASQKAYLLELLYKGKALEGESDFLGAMRLYARALELWPNHEEARARYMHARAQEGRQKSAQTHNQGTTSSYPSGTSSSASPGNSASAADHIYSQYLASKERYRFPEQKRPDQRIVPQGIAPKNLTKKSAPEKSTNSMRSALEAERRLQKEEPALQELAPEPDEQQKELELIRRQLAEQKQSLDFLMLCVAGLALLQAAWLVLLAAVLIRQKKQLPLVQATPLS